MKKPTIKIIDDEDFYMNLQNMHKSNSCRGAHEIKFNLDFVPRLKPKVDTLIPSPMLLGTKCNIMLNIEELELYEKRYIVFKISYNSDNPFDEKPREMGRDGRINATRFATIKLTKNHINLSEKKETANLPNPKKKTVAIKHFKLDEYDGILGCKGVKETELNRKTSILQFMEKKKIPSSDNLVN
jgi:hypothetical protein